MKNKTKQVVITTVVLSAAYIGLAYCGPTKSQEAYQIGGPMPKVEELGRVLGVRGWQNSSTEKKGYYKGFDLNGDGRPEFTVSYIC